MAQGQGRAPGRPAALAGPWAVRPAVDIRHGIVRKQRDSERARIDVGCKLPTFKFAFEVRTMLSHHALRRKGLGLDVP